MAAAADIHTREDCERLVRAFYTRALSDPVIGFIFTDVARLDVEAHVPQIASFWETVLLGAHSYAGGAFAPHAQLDARVRLRAGHFKRWLWLWEATVDEHFAGPRAQLAKSHARRVAHAFSRRLEARRAAQSADSPGADCDGGWAGADAELGLPHADGERGRPHADAERHGARGDGRALLTVLTPGR